MEQQHRCMETIRVTFAFLIWLHHYRMCESKVILTATDGAVSVPGGYVVPLNGSLTLKCNATMYPSVTSLHWNITLNGSTSVRGSGGTLSRRPQGKYSVPDSLLTENPTLLRIHNLRTQENGSTCQCGVPDPLGVSIESSQSKVVFVEGAPLCPKVNILTNTVNCIILTWNLDGQVLLPVAYTISVTTLSGEIIFSQNTSQTQLKLTGRGIPTLTYYTVTVVACTRAGCSQNCDRTWFSVPPKVSAPGPPAAGTTDSSPVPPVSTEIIIAVAVAAFVGGILLTAVVIGTCCGCILCCQKSKSKGMYKADSENKYDMVYSHSDGMIGRVDSVRDTPVDTTQIVMQENPSYVTVHARAEV